MKRTRKTTARRVMAATAASAVGLLAVPVVAASPAAAFCYAQGDGRSMNYQYNGHIVARERAISGTCDGDEIYNGQLADPYNDGYAARARFKDGSYNGIAGYATTSAWNSYRFYDQTGDSTAYFQVYSSPASRPSYWEINRGH